MQPGSLVHVFQPDHGNFWEMPSGGLWLTATVVACYRIAIDLAWQCTVLHDNRILELVLEDVDMNKTWWEV